MLHNIHYKERDKLAVDLVKAAVELAYDLGSDVLVAAGPEANGVPLRRMHVSSKGADYLEHGKPELPKALASAGRLSVLAREAAHGMGAGTTSVTLDALLQLLGHIDAKGSAADLAARVCS